MSGLLDTDETRCTHDGFDDDDEDEDEENEGGILRW